MAIEGLRFVLLFGLVAVIAWVAAGAFHGSTPDAASLFPDASLCIHRPAP